VPIRTASRANSNGRPAGRISARMVVRIAALLRARGIDPGPVCAEVGLRIGELSDSAARISYDDCDALVECAVARLGAAGLGAALAYTRDDDTYDATGLVLVASPTLREGFSRAFRFQRLWGDGERFVLDDCAGSAAVRFRPGGAFRTAHAVLSECALVEVMLATRFMTEPAAIARAVRFAHEPLGAVDQLEDVFGVAPSFGEDHNQITIDSTWADRASSCAHVFFQALFERQAARAMGALGDERTFRTVVRAVVRADLGGGRLSLGNTARKLKMSPRTLQRRLSAEHTTFDAIVDEERRALATAMLERGRSATEVAFLVGFADTSALARARRRWSAPG
jgi:AraC-like DNA-binding protein